ncbi:hypothetical protein ALI22I_21180 [Saccharothrix sp. ALI-22-I]|uniref:hypothetical protein n=1 Tax=Saccharothrix sp. ALI-22-I TaxID=1933778 RepID=UPI00097BFEEA|nr:hypothetical protein [Saccharothrix sp. ALI-22-I]ONI87806.1 hypothetical protein ALI22I_21180 [Saccharothrix sp. ALI-22-I]
MKFIQLIEYETHKIEEINRLLEQWREEGGGEPTVLRAVQAADRDRPNHYVDIVEFPSYEEAMRNSARPETDRFAKELAALCDGPVRFRNLDVNREEMI